MIIVCACKINEENWKKENLIEINLLPVLNILHHFNNKIYKKNNTNYYDNQKY